MTDQGWRGRLKAKRDRAVAVVGGGGMALGSLLLFRPWDQLLAAALKGAERLPEPLQTMATMAACKGKRLAEGIPAPFSAAEARNRLPEVCHSDLGARLGAETMELAARGAAAASALAATVAAGKLYGYFTRPVDPEFLEAAPMGTEVALRPGPHHRQGLPGMVGKAVMRVASRGAMTPARA